MIGKGTTTTSLSESEILSICHEGFDGMSIDGKGILLIIPDHTRTAPMDMMFRVMYRVLAPRVDHLDFLIALGTHPPLSMEAIFSHVGISDEEHRKHYPKARFFNHRWNDPGQLLDIGTISDNEVADISGGLMKQTVHVTINKMITNYDLLIILGPTFPHEVVGFSGGNKYLFPGIAGPEIIDMFHWLGALITSPEIIGTKHTPVRRVVDRAAAMVSIEKKCMSLVVEDDTLAGLFVDTPEAAWEAAADLSMKIHIVHKERAYKKVLACAPPMYEDLWTGGKCMYKLEPVVADGGELIIYAPHIKSVSVSHGEQIEKIGYHVRDYFLEQPHRFKDVPGGVKAHSTHVKGIGSFENGEEKPRIKVTLATQIPESVCRKINLGYRDSDSIKIDDWKNREDEGILYVPKAGEMLYRLD